MRFVWFWEAVGEEAERMRAVDALKGVRLPFFFGMVNCDCRGMSQQAKYQQGRKSTITLGDKHGVWLDFGSTRLQCLDVQGKPLKFDVEEDAKTGVVHLRHEALVLDLHTHDGINACLSLWGNCKFFQPFLNLPWLRKKVGLVRHPYPWWPEEWEDRYNRIAIDRAVDALWGEAVFWLSEERKSHGKSPSVFRGFGRSKFFQAIRTMALVHAAQPSGSTARPIPRGRSVASTKSEALRQGRAAEIR